MTHQPGHIKRDPASGAVAIRTDFADSGRLAAHAWLTATVRLGAQSMTTAEVAAWDDLYVPGDE